MWPSNESMLLQVEIPALMPLIDPDELPEEEPLLDEPLEVAAAELLLACSVVLEAVCTAAAS